MSSDLDMVADDGEEEEGQEWLEVTEPSDESQLGREDDPDGGGSFLHRVTRKVKGTVHVLKRRSIRKKM